MKRDARPLSVEMIQTVARLPRRVIHAARIGNYSCRQAAIIVDVDQLALDP